MTMRPMKPMIETFYDRGALFCAIRAQFLAASRLASGSGLIAVLALPLRVNAAGLLLRHAGQRQQLSGAIGLTIAAMMTHGALLAFALILSKGST